MRATQRAVAERLDYILYFAIASLGALQATSVPPWAKETAAVLLAGLVALKAKRSPNEK